MRFLKSKEEKERIDLARWSFDTFAAAASAASPHAAVVLAREFNRNEVASGLSERERSQRAAVAFRGYAANVLADDHLTSEEEDAFVEVCEALGITQEQLQNGFGEILSRLMVARLNNGRLQAVAEHKLMTKAGEEVYLEIGAELLKEVSIREWQSGSTGFSFRIVKGVRYHVGQTRGKSVVVGTELKIEDVGLLAISSKRIAFMGEQKTLEIPFAKLMNLDVYADGIRLHASNRQRAPLFRLQANTADVVAATVNAVAQQLDE
jgi:hypothetical protein